MKYPQKNSIHFKITSVKLDGLMTLKYFEKNGGELQKAKWIWVLKHRGANHPVASGVYETEKEAIADLSSIPSLPRHDDRPYCQGCGIGCFDEYEVVRFFLRPRKFVKLKVTHL